MANKSKNKGSRFERELVNIAKEHNIPAKRAWGSDGRSFGLDKEVDMVLGNLLTYSWSAQCKIRKRIAGWMKPDFVHVDIQIIREDRGRPLVVMDYEDFLSLIEGKIGGNKNA